MEEAAMTGQEIIDDLTAQLAQATGTSNMVDACIHRLQMYINAVQAQEAALLKKFGVQTEAELQAAFNKFYNESGLIHLSGADLDRLILEDYRSGLDKELKEINSFLKRRIIPAMEQVSVPIAAEGYADYIKQLFNMALNGLVVEVTEKGGRLNYNRKVSSGRAVVTNEKGQFSLMASKLTRAQKDRILDLIKEEKRLSRRGVSISSKVNGSTVTTTTTIDLNWYDITKGKTGDWASKNLSSTQIKNRNMKIKELILRQINGSYRSIASKYIDMMLGPKLDSTMFFVGQNVNDITGIVGEISAVIAVSELLKGVNQNTIVQWVATHKINGKQLSVDIVLKNLGGIQVKHTAKDIANIPEIDIHFAEGDAHDILTKLEKYTGFHLTDLQTIFESESFNVPAKAKGKKWVQTSLNTIFYHGYNPKDWDDFITAYWYMDDVIQQVHQFFTAFAPDFLYMSGGYRFQNQLATLDQALDTYGMRGNILYIVGGKPQLMSSSLKVIQEDLKNLLYIQGQSAHFNLSTTITYLENSKQVSYNFVDYKNQGEIMRTDASAKIRSSMRMKV